MCVEEARELRRLVICAKEALDSVGLSFVRKKHVTP